jgi:PAS domain S-box-containing protein
VTESGHIFSVLESALDHMDQGISVVDADLRVVVFNQKFLELLDLPGDRFKPGFHLSEAFRYNAERGEYGEGDVETQVRERLELAGRFERHRMERTRPDGTVLEIHDQPLDDGGLVTTYTDITQRKLTEEALKKSEHRQALILEAVAEGIYEWDIDKDTLYVTPRVAEILQLPTDQLGPEDWNKLIHPDDFEKYRHALRAHFRGHSRRLECEVRIRWPTGEYRWFSDRGVAIRNEAGRAVKLVGAIMDITDRKNAERRIAEKDAQLELALTHMPGGMVLGDRDLNYVLFNKKYVELHDFPKDLVKVGGNMRDEAKFQEERGDFDDGDTQATIKEAFETYRRGEPTGWERELADGRTLQFNYAPTPDGGFVIIATDITPQKRMEASLKTSEERHSLALRAVNEAIYDWDLDSNEVYYSPRLYRILGQSLDELRTAADWQDRIHPDDVEAYDVAVGDHLKGKTERLECEFRFRGRDGKWRWARQHGLASRDHTGHAYRMAGSIGDITEEKEVAAELEALRVRVVDAIETLDAGFLMWDADDRLYMFNSKYAEFLTASVGTDVSDILVKGIEFEEFMREPYRRGLYQDLPKKMHEEQWLTHRIARHRNPTGPREFQIARESMWLQCTERRTNLGDTVAIYTDITELKHREEALQEAREMARKANEAKSDFLASMSHELRTPLNAIIGITEMMVEEAEDEGDETGVEPLKRVQRAGRHLLELINEVLDLSKVEAGRMELNIREFEVSDVVDEVVTTAEALAKVKNNHLSVTLADDIGLMHADPTRLRQVILNLISNACKFTQDGTIGLSLERAPREDSPGISINVSDTGIGMTPEQLDIVFQPFSQAATTTAVKYGGTGLGLTISREYCRLMGGDITADSEPGVGTTFRVWLPINAEASA